MSKKTIKVGNTELKKSAHAVKGDWVSLDGMEFYEISHYDKMRPFFISLVSDTDQWLFLSSLGGLSAGRKNPENALFPYYTDDKIHDSHDLTGSKTILMVSHEEQTYLWEPFSDRYEGMYEIERHLYKNIYGNQILFEEYNLDLGMSFFYGWSYSQKYGIIKKSRLVNRGRLTASVKLLDGMQNILPYGVELKMQTESSTLLDAYKKNELMTASDLGLFLLSSVPVDKAEPSEALMATTVWQTGLTADQHLLSAVQLDKFRRGLELSPESDVRAERGAFFVQSSLVLLPGKDANWYFAAEINQGPAEVFNLHHWLRGNKERSADLTEDIDSGTKRLIKIVASADGLQSSTDKMLTARHFANVLFNVMRGGIFDDHYNLPRKDLISFFHNSNGPLALRQASFLNALPQTVYYPDLLKQAKENGDPNLQRLCLEYLPLTFSRRHGDPSRPWNHFSIELRDEDGEKTFFYQGNWRDIFQNWEALALSYPHFIESMITKFVNATTNDGYNPYRITRNGIDWELIEEDNPWSYIGYWGDHQIIYLLKLLELSRTHHPDALQSMLTQKIYSYANVPYRIKDYDDILSDPRDTIVFDHEMQQKTLDRVEEVGSDGKLVCDKNGHVLLVNFSEKILVTLLAKLSNFIPEGGIWLNTQRPEWNDANNALVGNGISMVTLYYIRRYVVFCQKLFSESALEDFEISKELADFLDALMHTFSALHAQLASPMTKVYRRQVVDELGIAGTVYRNAVYKGSSGEATAVSLEKLKSFFTAVLACTDDSILKNQRSDKLFHAYNLLRIEPDGGIHIRHLYEMLEGQVAVLSAGKLTPKQAVEVLKALRKSTLYRADQHSYILYPNRNLPRFEVKNNISESRILSVPLLRDMIQKEDFRIVEKDISGAYHFNGHFNNRNDVDAVLEDLDPGIYKNLTKEGRQSILDIFEEIFDHESFTGRSGTFFGYEGLGSIYWHMVSKLLLAVEECCQDAIESGSDAAIVDQLIAHYYDIREGIGFNKTPDNYGAFPTDPYSHTPGHAGARQPGMTGQVKEDIIARFGELGVLIQDGGLVFNPRLLRSTEFFDKASTFAYIDISGREQEVQLPSHSLAFTYCQVPVIYTLGQGEKVVLSHKNGKRTQTSGLYIDASWCDQLFSRSGAIEKIEVSFDRAKTQFS